MMLVMFLHTQNSNIVFIIVCWITVNVVKVCPDATLLANTTDTEIFCPYASLYWFGYGWSL